MIHAFIFAAAFLAGAISAAIIGYETAKRDSE